MEALISIALLWVLWLASTRRFQRRVVRPLAACVVVFLVLTSPFTMRLAAQALTFPMPTDTGGKVDAIVVLGRGDQLRDRRMDLTRSLWQENRAPRIFASGMLDAKPILQFLQESGIPGQHLSGEECSQTTEENGLYTAAILYSQGIRKVLLVTDPFHMWRSLLVFRSFGFSVIPHSTPLPTEWSSLHQAYMLLREALALVQYRFTDRFQPRSLADLEQPPEEVLTKIKSWNCLVLGT